MPAPLESTILYVTMVGWAAAGLAAIAYDAYRLGEDVQRLDAIDGRSKEEVGKWTDANLSTGQPLARWIQTMRNIDTAGEVPDSAAITDAVWSQERSRHFVYRFFARNAILVGLLFTIYGLSVAIGTITPALASELTTLDAWKTEVIKALKRSMAGMDGAFTASMLGVATSLGLHFLALVLVTWKHERYLARLDAVIQGQLIPFYSPESRRQSALKESLDAFKDQVAAFTTLYRDSLDRAEEQRNALLQVGGTVSAATLALTNAVTAFAAENERLAQSANKLEKGHAKVAAAVKDGLGGIDRAVGEFRTRVAEPFAAKLEGEKAANKAIVEKFGVAATALEAAGSRVETVVGQLGEAHGSVARASEAIEERLSASLTAFDAGMGRLEAANERHLDATGARDRDLTAAIGKLASDTGVVAGRIDAMVSSAVQRENTAVQHLIEIHEQHRKAVAELYEAVARDLSKSLADVGIEANTRFATALGEGVRETVDSTHRHLTGLDVAFRELATAQQASAQAVQDIARALGDGGQQVTNELRARQKALDDLIVATAQDLAARVDGRGQAAAEGLTRSINQAVADSLARQERLIADLDEALGRRWEELLKASILVSAAKAP